MAVDWIWLIFIFALGACVGSFLNVVIYRLPRGKSLVSPPSACPACGKPIRFYNNIPLISWLVLKGRCSDCSAPISCRYFIIELLTSLLFGGVYLWFFWFEYRQTGLPGSTPIEKFFTGGWLFYLVVITLAAAFLAASAVDLEMWIIPLEICWFSTMVGLAGAAIAPFLIHQGYALEKLFPSAAYSPKIAALTVGAALGLLVSLAGLYLGIIKPSYEIQEQQEDHGHPDKEKPEPQFDDRKEILKEVIFLLPVVIGAFSVLKVTQMPAISEKWCSIIGYPVISGLLGALAGYFAGCAVVWITRILGTLAFAKEAMGLGDVHLMGAAGAVIGAKWVLLAFFLAPFLGILWALYQAFFQKIRQIPYGPFLSIAVFSVIIFHDWIQRVLTDFYGF